MTDKLILAVFLTLSINISTAATTDNYELKLIKHEALDGDSGAQLLYGLALLEGRYSLKPDYPEAVRWLGKSAHANNHYAELVLANCYSAGKGVEKSPEQAVNWWQKAAEGNNAKAQYHLGKAYLDGDGVGHDDKKAIDWLTLSAEAGNADAQYLIGKMYHDGYVVAQDHKFAKNWLSRATSNGHPDAINLLGIIDTIFESGTIVRRNSIDALKEDADKGDPDAQFELGMHYKNGSYSDTQQPNPMQAVFWLRKAADNGDLLAMKVLSHIYKEGYPGVVRDEKKAEYWLSRSKGRN